MRKVKGERHKAKGEIYFSEEKYMKRSRAAMKTNERKAKGTRLKAKGRSF
jgi:hypothetical protein